MESTTTIKIYVSNLPRKATEETLEEYFSSFGPVRNAHLSRFPNGNSKRFATVELAYEFRSRQLFFVPHSIEGRRIKVAPFHEDRWTYKKRIVYFECQSLKDYPDFIMSGLEHFGEIQEFEINQEGKGHVIFKSAAEAKNCKSWKCFQIQKNTLVILNNIVKDETEEEKKKKVSKEEKFQKKKIQISVLFKRIGVLLTSLKPLTMIILPIHRITQILISVSIFLTSPEKIFYTCLNT